MVDGTGSSAWQSNPRRAGDIGVRNENISSSRCTGLKLRDFRCACYAKTHWRSASRQAEHANRHPTGHRAPVSLRHLAHVGFVGLPPGASNARHGTSSASRRDRAIRLHQSLRTGTATEAARRLGRSRPILSELIHGRSSTPPEVAIALESKDCIQAPSMEQC